MTAVIDHELLDRARSLAGLIDDEATPAEALTTITEPVVQALRDSELFWIMVPRELGGLEADIATSLAVFEELARADGSTGWSLMANATSSAFAGIYTGDEAVRAMFGDGLGIHAGMLGPVGAARRVDGGYMVSGRYSFGSGCAHATYFGGGTMETDDDGQMVLTESGMPSMRVFLIPADRVDLRGNWDVMGLSATGSYDYVVDEQFVPDAFTYSLLEAAPQRGGARYNIGLFAITAAGHAGFALGVGRRALDEVLALAKAKVRMGGFEPIGNQQMFQHDFAMHDAAMRAARAYVYDSFVEAEQVCDAGGVPDAVQQQRMRQSTTYATRVAADAARFAYTWAGSHGLRPGPIQRAFRDIHAGTQHIYVDNNTLTGYTATLLAAE